jgi:5-methylcytosine-specific restriction endonuclease McrA
MIFIDNKYTRLYYSIISRAHTRVLEEDVYSEGHHIIPKSLGGNNRKENIARLTAREHFIVHWLLTKMVSNPEHKWKMITAFSTMLYRRSDNQRRYRITGRIFEIIKQQISKSKRERFAGANNPMFGRKHSPETIEKMRIMRKDQTGMSHTAEAKAKISKANKGLIRNAAFREKMSKIHKGRIETEETKLKKSLSHTGMKHSEETLRKLSENSGRAKKVEINGVVYKSMKLAASTIYPDLPHHKGIRRIKKMLAISILLL